MNKKILLVISALIFALNSYALEKHGVGILLGDPTGLTGKYLFDPKMAIHATAGWNYSNDEINISSDFVRYFPDHLKLERASFSPYLGIGLAYKHQNSDLKTHHDNEISVGLHVPLGLNYRLEKMPAELFLEPVLFFKLNKPNSFNGDFAIGGRYLF